MKNLVLVLALFVVPAVGSRVVADEGARKAAIDLMKEIVPKDAYEAMVDLMLKQMSASMGQGKPMPAETLNKLKLAINESLTYDELLSWTGDIYSKFFTAKEIGDLATFYRTPTGKKAAKLLPQISGELGAKMGPILQQRLPAAMKKHGLGPQ